MAEAIKHENQLPTVKLSLGLEGSAGSAPTVEVEVDRGQEVVGRLTLGFDDLGVGPDFDPATYRYGEPAFAFSERARREIGGHVDTALEGGPVLWLQLASPVGHLASLPWETMLGFLGAVPIVRVPNFSLFSPLAADPIDVVVCLSEPEAKEPFAGARFLGELVRMLLQQPGPAMRAHLFADAQTHRKLSADRGLRELGERVVLYDPTGRKEPPAEEGGSAADATGGVKNPWLLWIVEAMREATADVVHFVTHGYVQNCQSALALAESPAENRDPLWARFIAPGELASCLDQLGAWSVGFTSPPFNFSSLGLRQFFDDVARLRAGPVLHHEAGRDPGTHELWAAYTDLFAGRPPVFRSSVSLYAHPGLFPESAPTESVWTASFADALVSKGLGEPTPVSAADPAWSTSTRRYLEQTVARMFPEQVAAESTIQKAAADGVEQALKFVNEVLAKHAGGGER